MSLTIRLEKLEFIVAELQFGLHLARHAPDDFIARMLARHILIRAENFIAHARSLRKPLNQAGFNTRQFHSAKEAYAKFFDEYFQTARDRLGAHIQDFDFGRRIELWNDIEVVKIRFFVEGAKEIYEGLNALSIPGYAAYMEPPELMDSDLNDILVTIKASAADTGCSVEFGADTLAMTRANTISTLNMAPLHLRAGQLSLIRRWIETQRNLITQIEKHEGMRRILEARIVTDIVSFCDCLVTRNLWAGAPQEMEGLNTLLKNNGERTSTIDAFLSAFSFDSELQKTRALRDRIGAHLEISESATLPALLSELDSFDLHGSLQFFDRAQQIFRKICFEVLYLRLYAADGQRARGVSANSRAVTPFDPDDPGPPPSRNVSIADYNSDNAYHDQWEIWLHGRPVPQQDARHYFWKAFLHSEVVEMITETEGLSGGSVRYGTHELRKAHRFILSILLSAKEQELIEHVFELMLQCRSGDPYMLAEILIRYAASADAGRLPAICYCIGELASWPHDSVRRLLKENAASGGNWNVRFQATLALFKIFLRTEGITRINTKKTSGSYTESIEPLIAGATGKTRLLYLISFASQFSSRALSFCGKPFAGEYRWLQTEIEVLCRTLFAPESYASISELAAQLLGTHDYVGLCILIATRLNSEGENPFADDLLAAACTGKVVTASNDLATRHLALCFYLRRDFPKAIEIAEDIAKRNPDEVRFQILVVQILAEMKSAETRARIAAIKTYYKLSQEDQDTLSALEQQAS